MEAAPLLSQGKTREQSPRSRQLWSMRRTHIRQKGKKKARPGETEAKGKGEKAAGQLVHMRRAIWVVTSIPARGSGLELCLLAASRRLVRDAE